MKAAIFHGPHRPLTLGEVQVADPGPREVLVRTMAAGLCHSDLHFIDGTYALDAPAVLGHEVSGIVEKVGEGVIGLRPGDHVIGCLSVFCGHCGHCTSGRPYSCDHQHETRRGPQEPPRLSQAGAPVGQFYELSAFAELMLVHEHALVKIRSDMPFDRAALIGCAVTTGMGAVINTARVEVGATVAVIGCGGVGLSAVNGAAIAGAGRIIAVDISGAKLDLARDFGATDTVDASGCDPVEAVRDLTRGGVQYSFEALGLKRTSEQAFEMLAPSGIATIIGMVPEGQRLEIDPVSLLYDRRLQGSNMGSNRFRVDMPRYVDFYLSGRLHLDRMISRRLPLAAINEGFDDLRAGRVARSVITFDP
ncbi:Zn-dependent alcohol dehydrogenase [Rhodobacter sp. SGA-6-6]|uniref:Zn-dependent alcohol dehydrogenase n=1 Tax=Rhodobacter sp. SGA-6-6 TaxID=2710882 RepID=UPI0013E9E070|nr:Zn-dependent alcohol dehydrogenase [Rhodobacter sp. SGA-6-6]NGM46219.1 Zn-dependent alcohol dehydrogenase [Rhodobacter sp. SGA-6-6]